MGTPRWHHLQGPGEGSLSGDSTLKHGHMSFVDLGGSIDPSCNHESGGSTGGEAWGMDQSSQFGELRAEGKSLPTGGPLFRVQASSSVRLERLSHCLTRHKHVREIAIGLRCVIISSLSALPDIASSCYVPEHGRECSRVSPCWG